jgi:hypothetical protein
LLGTGFYDSNLFKRNLWMADKFSSPVASQLSLNMLAVLRNEAYTFTGKRDLLKDDDTGKFRQNQKVWGAHWNLLYGSTLPIGREDGRVSQIPFHLLSEYESSFHLFLKRAYLLTPLSGAEIFASTRYESKNLSSSKVARDLVDLHPLLLNMLNRQILLNSRLGLPTPSQFSTDSRRHSTKFREGRKDATRLASRHNVLSGPVLETAINVSQATAATPESSTFYSLRSVNPNSRLSKMPSLEPFKLTKKPCRRSRFTQASVSQQTKLPF